MTPSITDRLKEVQRQYAEMEHNTAALKQAQQEAEEAARAAENNYRSLTDKCREEYRVRQRLIEQMQQQWRVLFGIAALGGAVGMLGAAGALVIARWLWAMLLAALSSGWAALAAWWSAS